MISVKAMKENIVERNSNSKGARWRKAILKAVATEDHSRRTMPADRRAILLFLVFNIFLVVISIESASPAGTPMELAEE